MLGTACLAQQALPSEAKVGQVRLELEVLPAGGMGLTHEPVVVVLRVVNLTDEPLWVQCAGGTVEGFELSVWDEHGHRLTDPPKLPAPAVDFLYGIIRVPAGKASRQITCLLDGIYCFDRPGTYEARASLWDWTTMRRRLHEDKVWQVASLAQASATYRVTEGTPDDHRRLAAVLTSCFVSGSGFGVRPPLPALASWRETHIDSHPHIDVGRVLRAFHHDAMLSYLAQITYERHRPEWFEAIARVGTPLARELLQAMATSRRPWIADPAGQALAHMQATDGDMAPRVEEVD